MKTALVWPLLAVLALAACGEDDDYASRDSNGPICGNKQIRGVKVDPIGTGGGCGIANPVKVSSVSGVMLQMQPVLNCEAATALNTYVREGAKPAIGKTGGGLQSIDIVAHYACRRRNNLPQGKLSEHARGNAVDIAGFNLRNGETLTVLGDWASGKHAKTVQALHKTACGPFGTVLGPRSDRFHRDHFHFDVADYRSGPYCR
ncbi:extensin-like domain-containing protein [Oceanomicrobium pacificus]|nr:extensin family protein [Oceanomicrobium pacificus]